MYLNMKFHDVLTLNFEDMVNKKFWPQTHTEKLTFLKLVKCVRNFQEKCKSVKKQKAKYFTKSIFSSMNVEKVVKNIQRHILQ